MGKLSKIPWHQKIHQPRRLVGKLHGARIDVCHPPFNNRLSNALARLPTDKGHETPGSLLLCRHEKATFDVPGTFCVVRLCEKAKQKASPRCPWRWYGIPNGSHYYFTAKELACPATLGSLTRRH